MADTYNQKTDRQDTAGSVYQREIFKHVFWLMPALRIFSARNPDAFPLISQWHMFGYRGNYRGATASDFHGLPFV